MPSFGLYHINNFFYKKNLIWHLKYNMQLTIIMKPNPSHFTNLSCRVICNTYNPTLYGCHIHDNKFNYSHSKNS